MLLDSVIAGGDLVHFRCRKSDYRSRLGGVVCVPGGLSRGDVCGAVGFCHSYFGASSNDCHAGLSDLRVVKRSASVVRACGLTCAASRLFGGGVQRESR